MRLRREQIRYIEFELRHYKQTKESWESLRESILHGADYTISDMPRGSNISNSTQAKAFQLVSSTRIEHLEKIIKSVERVLMGLPVDRLRLVELRYWTYPKYLTDEGIAAELNCDRSTLKRWNYRIIEAIAAELGLKV